MLKSRLRTAITTLRPGHFLLAFLTVPFLVLPDLPATTGRIQALISLAILLAGIIMSLRIADYGKQFSRTTKGIFVCLSVPLLITVFARVISHKPVYFLGLDPDYMGIFAWLGILAAGIFWAPHFRTLLSKRGLLIYGALVLLSVVIDNNAVLHNLPAAGVFLTGTSLALVANLLVLTSISQETYRYPGLAIGILGVLLSQDLVGFCCLLGLIVYAAITLVGRRQKLLIGGLLALVFLMPFLFSSVFWGLRQTNVASSTHELAGLYQQSFHNFKPYQIFYNNGPATLSTDINNQNPVPRAILKEAWLTGNAFGKHGLLYDYFVFYGLLATLCLVVAIGLVWKHWLQGRVAGHHFVLYCLLLINALLFPPTLYFTSLFCVVQFGLLAKTKLQKASNGRMIPTRLAVLGFVLGIVASAALLGFTDVANTGRQSEPATSSDFTQSFDQNLQNTLEQSIRDRLTFTSAPRGSAVLLDVNTGQVMAAVDVISSDPMQCQTSLSCRNPKQHAALQAWEPGSVMKPLLVAAGLDTKKIRLSDTFLDPPYQKIDDLAVYDALPHEPQTIPIQGVLNSSRNTGAIHIYRALGADRQRRELWHTYTTERYGFGRSTKLDPSEDSGYVRPIAGGRSLDRQYTMSAYGMSLTVTPVQLAAAYASLVNGGTYIAPHLAKTSLAPTHQVLSADTSHQMQRSLQEVFEKNTKVTDKPAGLILGGKTGTAPAYDTNLSYKPAADIGVFAGFAKTSSETLVLVVKIDEPKTKDFASYAARDTWLDIIKKLYW